MRGGCQLFPGTALELPDQQGLFDIGGEALLWACRRLLVRPDQRRRAGDGSGVGARGERAVLVVERNSQTI